MSTNGGERGTGEKSGAPSWQDYIDALKIEGRRYMPASMRKALQERDRQGCNPIDRKGQK